MTEWMREEEETDNGGSYYDGMDEEGGKLINGGSNYDGMDEGGGRD